ncbi:MAG TPA: hypothetical protein VN451_06045, partial [Chitinophagaceae bacterium]|nr:hypothetical protein [Chitinophagaceae bacterium]
MKKLNKHLTKTIFFLLLSVQAISQTETFDIATYTVPDDFKKDSKPGVINFTNINTSSGTFCVITIYASTTSSGNAQKDFTNEWNELVVTPYKTETNPKTETQTSAEGWKVVSAAAQAKLDGNDFYVLLTVISGFGKTLSIRSSLNDGSYSEQIDAFLATLELDKTKTPTVNNNITAPLQTTGGSGKFGSMMYTAPAGWKEQIFSDGVIFKPLDLPADEYLAMQIMQPLNASGTLEQALAQSYNEAATMYNATKMHYAGGAEYEKKEAKRSFRGWDYIRCSGGIKMGGGDYPPEYGLDLFVIKVNNRFERIALLKSRKSCQGSMSRYYPDERPAYYNAIEKFLFSIQFADLLAPAIKPGTIKGDGLVGVWEGISLSVGAVSTSDPLGVRYKVFTPIFLSNGQAYFGTKFPAEGMHEFNTWIRAENFRRDWGTWTFSNGRGVLKLPYGNLPMRMENNKFIITANNTDHAFHKLNSVDGARFNGTYVMNEAYEKIPVITFTADGRFTDKGAIKALYHESDDCTNPGLAPGSGTYEVKNHSVLFHFSDGRKINVAFLGSGYNIN